MMKLLTSKNMLLFLSLVTILHLGLVVMGGIRGYSPVPFWDMWDSFIGTYTELSQGNWGELWQQHNEHRILLSRLLFWLDFKLFNDSWPFLIFCNYLLALGGFWVIYSALQNMLKNEQNKFAQYTIGLVILCLLFSWGQHENFLWGFQSQFFLAQLLPLLAFYLLYQSRVSTHNPFIYFILACFAGIAALGSMANGALTLPLMAVLAVMMGMNWKQVVILASLSMLGMFLYFHHYTPPEHHGSLTDAILQHPIKLILYILVYLGNPFYHIFSLKAAAPCAGLFFVISSAYFAIQALKSRQTSSLQLALLTFLLYIGGTALATGGGRLIFGIAQATSSRYATPTLMGWAVLLVLFSPFLAKQASINARRLLPLILIPVLMLPYQFTALKSHTEKNFEQKIAALALELGINDQAQISIIYPLASHALDVSRFAVQHNLSIFGNPLLKDAAQLIGTKSEHTFPQICSGKMDEILPVDNDPRYVKVHGSLYDTQDNTVPKIVHILDKNRVIVGYALTGEPDNTGKLSGFKGYLQADFAHQPLILQGNDPGCE